MVWTCWRKSEGREGFLGGIGLPLFWVLLWVVQRGKLGKRAMREGGAYWGAFRMRFIKGSRLPIRPRNGGKFPSFILLLPTLIGSMSMRSLYISSFPPFHLNSFSLRLCFDIEGDM